MDGGVRGAPVTGRQVGMMRVGLGTVMARSPAATLTGNVVNAVLVSIL